MEGIDMDRLAQLFAGTATKRTPEQQLEDHNYNMRILLMGFQGDDADADATRLIADLVDGYVAGLRERNFGTGTPDERRVSKKIAEVQEQFMVAVIEALNELQALSVIRCNALGIELPEHPAITREEEWVKKAERDAGVTPLNVNTPGRAG